MHKKAVKKLAKKNERCVRNKNKINLPFKNIFLLKKINFFTRNYSYFLILFIYIFF